MNIGIIVAMQKELDLLLPKLERMSDVNLDDADFYCGQLGDHELVVHQCGIGKVNAAMGALTMIHNFTPDVVINTGVAGGADPEANIMDVVVGVRVAYHDAWCGPEVGWGIQGLPQYFEADEKVVAALPQRPDIKRGLICTGDKFIDTLDEVKAIKAKYPEALAVDMESGAIAQVCYRLQTPFMSLRVISDSPGAGRTNTVQYNDFWAEAPKHTFEIIRQLLLALK